jgi:hypothetical protein
VGVEPTDAKISNSAKLELWREAMGHLRYLNDETWRRFQFFLWFDFVVFVAAVATARSSRGLFVILFLFGFLFLFVARYVLKRNRIYYLQMLMKKALLEDELGFYREKFPGSGTDLAFPWRLTPEVVEELRKDPDAWVTKSIRGKGTLALWLFVTLEVWIGIYTLILFTLLWKVRF